MTPPPPKKKKKKSICMNIMPFDDLTREPKVSTGIVLALVYLEYCEFPAKKG